MQEIKVPSFIDLFKVMNRNLMVLDNFSSTFELLKIKVPCAIDGYHSKYAFVVNTYISCECLAQEASRN